MAKWQTINYFVICIWFFSPSCFYLVTAIRDIEMNISNKTFLVIQNFSWKSKVCVLFKEIKLVFWVIMFLQNKLKFNYPLSTIRFKLVNKALCHKLYLQSWNFVQLLLLFNLIYVTYICIEIWLIVLHCKSLYSI